MWKHRDLYRKKGQDSLVLQDQLCSEPQPSESSIYGGCEFDVFGHKDLKEHQFAPLYSAEKFTPKPEDRVPYKRGEVLVRAREAFELGDTLDSPTSLKKRKLTDPPLPTHVFIEPTAAVNTPIAHMFLKEDTKETTQLDLEYA
ncbi:uncharacterized protein B0P05DRAFT_562616 [Gilbertella persicaria]|uniref:uncharacterized protein n=1 Tax=Gilbertella persicaria TaxID=101096 RepID=UPI002220320D|nr:uncharacterized protein B0P05DRAFT_562616 [Gilbertella persicaria]KAI8051402.1 hypothetical protein B0P05DRAFT_562616 [Gilbertella persicaria]